MSSLVHTACDVLHQSLFAGGPGGALRAPLAVALLRTVLPARDYDNRASDEHSSLRAPWHAEQPEGVRVKREGESEEKKPEAPPAARDVKGNMHQLDAHAPSTLHATESRIGNDATATKMVDMSGGQWCTPQEIRHAADSLRAVFDTIYETAHESEALRLSRTFVALLLEPASLAIELAVARRDDALERRELQRLRRWTPPSDDEQRAVATYVEHLTVNFFAGCPELAFRVNELPADGLRALFVLLAHGSLVFGRESNDSAVRTRLDAFRHNSALERALGSRGPLIWGVCCAALDQCEPNYADALRHTLLLALDAAQTRISAMRQPYNASADHLETLRSVQGKLHAANLPLPRRRREHAPARPQMQI